MKQRCKFGSNGLYEGAAEFGRGYTYLTAIFASIICIIVIGIGIHLIRRTPVYTQKVTFTVTSSYPVTTTNTNNGTTTTNVVYDLTGTVSGCSDQIILNNYPTNISVGAQITAYTQVGCKNGDALVSPDNYSKIGWICIGVSLLVIIFTLINIFFVRRFKAVAAVEGGVGAANLLRNVF